MECSTAELHKTWSAFISLDSREDMESLLDDSVRPFGIHVNVRVDFEELFFFKKKTQLTLCYLFY